jgi:hypothetical protein
MTDIHTKLYQNWTRELKNSFRLKKFWNYFDVKIDNCIVITPKNCFKHENMEFSRYIVRTCRFGGKDKTGFGKVCFRVDDNLIKSVTNLLQLKEYLSKAVLRFPKMEEPRKFRLPSLRSFLRRWPSSYSDNPRTGYRVNKK